MPIKSTAIAILCLCLISLRSARSADTLHFAGYDWEVKTGFMGPGPNHWDSANATVDQQGRLHLKITQHDGQWYGAEITLLSRLGFGRYEWQIASRLDQFDDNVVLGLFNYPTPDVGADGTNEIDIEFARWGRPTNPPGNYTVWPPQRGTRPGTGTFDVRWGDAPTIHSFEWGPQQVGFESHADATAPGPPGHHDAGMARLTFAPPDPEHSIPQHPLPVHFNLWLFHGQPPKNGQEVEVIISGFHFTPAK